MSSYEGRLELTWTNKHLRLLAHDDGTYEWVDPSDYRVAEVRLLHDVEKVGTVSSDRSSDNLLIQGDALNALRSLALPEFAGGRSRGVRLAYIDPPFNTQQSFLQYDDALEHSVWLTMMRDRVLQILPLLTDDGSIWVHVDDSEQHRIRCVLDEVMGPSCFVATVVWEKRYSRSNDAGISTSHDFIHVYSPNPSAWNKRRNKLGRTPDQAKQYRNPDADPKGPWRAIPWDAPEVRPNLTYPITTPGGRIRMPPKGRHWSSTPEKWAEIVESGRAYFGRDDNGAPSLKRYLFEAPEVVPNSWWAHEEAGHSDEAKKESAALFEQEGAFSTPKPERLMRQIISIATDPGDVVLDCFLGSGTTAAVAQKMGRRWIGVERSVGTTQKFALRRLRKVVDGTDAGGVTEQLAWLGGGGFRVLEVAPSMFEEDEGLVFLTAEMTNSRLAEATAGQLGFSYEPGAAPFAGTKGRSRLAVIDGVVNGSVVKLLCGALDEGQQVVICGTAVDVEARSLLRTLRPGSTVRKIPSALLASYRYSARRNGDESSEVDA